MSPVEPIDIYPNARLSLSGDNVTVFDTGGEVTRTYDDTGEVKTYLTSHLAEAAEPYQPPEEQQNPPVVSPSAPEPAPAPAVGPDPTADPTPTPDPITDPSTPASPVGSGDGAPVSSPVVTDPATDTPADPNQLPAEELPAESTEDRIAALKAELASLESDAVSRQNNP